MRSSGTLVDPKLTAWSSKPEGSAEKPTFNALQGSCRITWKCSSCAFLAASTTITYTSPKPMWASFINFTLYGPALVSDASGTPITRIPDPFSVSAVLVRPDCQPVFGSGVLLCGHSLCLDVALCVSFPSSSLFSLLCFTHGIFPARVRAGTRRFLLELLFPNGASIGPRQPARRQQRGDPLVHPFSTGLPLCLRIDPEHSGRFSALSGSCGPWTDGTTLRFIFSSPSVVCWLINECCWFIC